MSAIFCCGTVQPYRPQMLDYESRFTTFINWVRSLQDSPQVDADLDLGASSPPFAVQLVRQVNYGPLESKRYFVPDTKDSSRFQEISEQQLISANFQKLNSYKNFRCETHDKFFEVNLYEKDPVNKHHWRANLARPSGSIDL